MQHTTTYNLSDLKSLTLKQYETAKQKAYAITQAQIGDKPNINHFKVDRIWNVGIMDILSVIIFVGALAISATHILYWASSSTPDVASAGYIISAENVIRIKQVGYLLMAEASMILFSVMYRIHKSYIALILAVIASVFVIVINVFGSGTFDPAGVLAPIFTIGVAFRLEQLISDGIQARAKVQTEYDEALAKWKTAQLDITQHDAYRRNLYNSIWEYLTVTLRSNSDFMDADRDFKIRAVQRELARETWQEEVEQTPVNFTQAPSHPNGSQRLAQVSN